MSDDFNARYRLLKCVLVDDGIRTHNAQEMATGKVVMVHINDAAGPEEVDALRAQLALLPPGTKNKVLETATLPSGFAVVTEFLPASLSFRAWLALYTNAQDAAPADLDAASRATSADGQASPTATAASPDASTPLNRHGTPFGGAPIEQDGRSNAPAGSFTALFGATAGNNAALTATHSPTANAGGAGTPLKETSPGRVATPEPGSFTLLFNTPLDAVAPTAGLRATTDGTNGVPAAPVSGNPSPAAGAFTAMFGAPPQPRSAPAGSVVDSGPHIPPASFQLSSSPQAPLHAPMQLAAIPRTGPHATPTPIQIQGATPAPSVPFGSTPVASVPAPTKPADAAVAPAAGFTQMFGPGNITEKGKPSPQPAAMPARQASVRLPNPEPATHELGKPSPSIRPNQVLAAITRPSAHAQSAIPAPVSAVASPPVHPVTDPAATSPFGWDAPNASSAPSSTPVQKAPPGEFTLMFAAPGTAAPMPDTLRPSPMSEAPPPTFSPLTPEASLQSPPVEPMHRVMSGHGHGANAGIVQGGASPIPGNVLGGGPPSNAQSGGNFPAGLNYGGSYQGATNHQGASGYQGMPEFPPIAPTPSYPIQHPSPLFSPENKFAGEPGQSPGILPPPIFAGGGSTPLSSLGGAAPRPTANAGPSEYTQLIANGRAPVVADLKPAAPEADVRPKRRLPTGLIVVINAVLLIAALLIFFVLQRPVPTVTTVMPAAPVMPSMPTAPKLNVPGKP